MPVTVLALVPHPDDAEIYAGGLLAKLASEGATAQIVVATDGCCGSFLEHSAQLVELRGEEMRRAAAVLGAQPPTLLGFPDMGLDTLPAGVLREHFVRAIRQHRPDIVITQDLKGKRRHTLQTLLGPVHVLAIRDLIEMKRASGRPQDLADIEALEKLL